MPSIRAFVLLSAILLIISGCLAQDSATGSIRGTVMDSSGGRIAQASVAIVNTATGARSLATSDSQGRFAIEMLSPGDYSLRIEAQGMSPEVTPQLHVSVGGVMQPEFRLSVAGVQEQITVSAEPSAVQTQPSAVSTLLGDMPLNGRRFPDLMLLSSNVTQDPRSLNSSTNGDMAVGGIRGFQNRFLVDGGDNNNAFYAQARGRYREPYGLSTDTVQEFRVSTNSYGAESGRSGGAVVNVVTKSGSNIRHGTAWPSIISATVPLARPIHFSLSSRTTASSRPEARSAVRSNATKLSSFSDSISTCSTSRM